MLQCVLHMEETVARGNLLVLLALWTYVAIVFAGTMWSSISRSIVSAPATALGGLVIWIIFFMIPLVIGWLKLIMLQRSRAVSA